MKKYAAIILAALLVLTLSACGDNKPAAAPAAEPTSTVAPTEAPASDYETVMNNFVTEFDSFINGDFEAFIDELSDEQSDEEFQAWANEFVSMQEEISDMADMLAEVEAPAEYEESHANITVAVAAIYDAMQGFSDAVDAEINGDTEAFNDGIATFVGNVQAAQELWNEAVVDAE